MKNLSVLIVDDNTDFSDGLKRIFESFGWSAQIADNQEKAKIVYSEDIFDLVIVDCFIPGTDGFSISKELSDLNKKALGPSIFFLMSGILVDAASKKEALSYSHIKSFIKKPVDTTALKQCLEEFFPQEDDGILDFFIQNSSNLDQFHAECTKLSNFDKIELPLFIKQVSELEFCGEIKFTQEDSETVMNFNDGEVTSIFGQEFEDSIGELLVGLGFLTRENLSRYISSDEFKQGKTRIGEALILKNYVSPHAVPLALKEQKRIRLDKLLSNNKKTTNFKISNRPRVEHETSMSLGTHEITRALTDYLNRVEDTSFNGKILRAFAGLEGSSNTIDLDNLVPIDDSDRKSLLNKFNDGVRLQSSEIKSLFCLLLCRSFEFSISEDNTSATFSEKNVIKDKLRFLAKKIKLETPYEILDLSSDNITDQRVSKKYQSLAKELHPDKLDKILNTDELKDAKHIFAEITKAFNSIKTAENRQTFESMKANQEAQDQIDCNNSLELAKKALHSGKYSEAIELLDVPMMHKIYPNEFGLYFLWASFKSKNHLLKQSPISILDTENKNLKNEPLYYYLKAIIANKSGDTQSFQKFIGLSLKADSHFLPARRELQIVRSQNAPKKTKSSWFSFKKSS